KYSYVLALADCKRMGHNLDVEGTFEPAITLLKQASALEPRKAEPHILLGSHFTFGGRYEEGKAAYLEALALQKDRPDEFVLFGLASAEYFMKHFAAAADWAEKCLTIEPRDQGAALILQKSREALAGTFSSKEIEIDANKAGP